MINKNASIYIQGAYGPSNFGDDALLMICIRLIKQSNFKGPIMVGVIYPNIANNWFSDIKWVEKVSNDKINYKVKYLLYGGGGQFYSFPLTRKKNKINIYLNKVLEIIQGKYTLNQLIHYFVNILNRKYYINIESEHKAAFCIGVGPYVPNSKEVALHKNILTSCEYLSVRDKESLEICLSWGIKNINLRTDPCFLKRLLFDKNYISNYEIKIKFNVAFIIRSWSHTLEGYKCYISLKKTAETLRSIGIKVKFISFDKEDDKRVFYFFPNEDIICYDPTITNPSEFAIMLQKSFDLIVSMRAHGIIIPATLGVPGICAEIEPKLKNIHLMLPNGTMIWRNPFNISELVSMVMHIIKNKKEYNKKIIEDFKMNEIIAEQSASEIIQWINNKID